MVDEAPLAAEIVETPFGTARRCNAISRTTGARCKKAARKGGASCVNHDPGSAGCWSRDGERQDPRLFPDVGGAYRTPPVDVMVEFLSAQERAVRIARQSPVITSISIPLVHGVLQGVVQAIYTFVPRERQVEALNALYDWQASLRPGVVRL